LEQQNSKGQSPTTKAVLEQTINKIASGAEDSEDMRAYSRRLIKKFDLDNDGVITLKELCHGLKTLNIYLTSDEREALMQKLDTNRDGDISDKELYKALSSVSIQDLR
jgi:Ca2+-binding EF-hand superfamily protein